MDATGPRALRSHRALLGALVVLLACATGDPMPPETLQAVTVTVSTSGEDVDADGYALTVGAEQRSVSASGTVTFADLAAGTYQVVLAGLAPNCAVPDGDTRTATVTREEGASVTFEVVCASVLATGGFTDVACPALALQAVSAAPLTPVAIGSVPTELAPPLFARVTWPGGDEFSISYVERGDDGTATLLAPLHPSGSMDGGTTSIRIAGGTSACPAVSFEVESLPEAPGEVAAVVDLLQEVVRIQADLVGTSVSELRGLDGATLPPVAEVPLLIAQSVLDHPDNPNSLRAVIDGTAPLAAGVSLEAADRILAATGFRAGLQAALDALRPTPAASAAGPARVGAMRVDAVGCLETPIEVPQQLNDCMELAGSAAFRLDGVGADALSDIGAAVGLAGEVPNAGAKLASAIMGAAIFAFQKVREGTAYLLPSELASIDVEASPIEFREDEEGPGDWAAEVTATSQGWELDTSVLDALAQVASLLGAYQTWLGRFVDADQLADLTGFVINQIVSAAIGTTEGSDVLRIEPRVFGPVDISDQAWSDRDLVPEVALQLTGHTEFEPRKPGESMLSVRSKDGMFGGRQITAPPLPLRVGRIDIDFMHDGQPTDVVVVSRPSQEVVVGVRVQDAKYPEKIQLDDDAGRAGSATLAPDPPATLTYIAPADLEALPDVLVVRGTATSGARGMDAEPRVATLEIRRAQIVVTPGGVCLQAGAQQTFSAEVVGLDDQGVTWSASQGAIDANGVYTAPSGLPIGTKVTITATSTADDGVEGGAEVTIGCVCQFTVTVAGETYVGQPGDVALYNSSGLVEGGLEGVVLQSTAQDKSASMYPTEIATGPGSYEIGLVGGGLGYSGALGYVNLEGIDDVRLSIYEYQAHTKLVGEVSGTVHDADGGEGDPSLLFLATFSIYPPPDGVYFGSYSCVVPE